MKKGNRRYQGPVSERHKNRELKQHVMEDLSADHEPVKIEKPRRGIHMDYKPKEDITTFELAMCIPFIVSGFYEHGTTDIEIPTDKNYGRHFILTPTPKFRLPR